MKRIDETHAPLKDNPKIISLSGLLLNDNIRVRVRVELSDTSQKPTLDLILADSKSGELAHSYIVGVIDPVTEFTMHIMPSKYESPFTIRCAVYQNAEKVFDRAETAVQPTG